MTAIVSPGVAQIRASDPPDPNCLDEEIDAAAKYSRIYFCTHPPDPLEGFVIGGFVFRSCSNQPVDNTARTNAKVGGTQASASATAIAIFYDRRIQDQIRLGDCAGQNQLVVDFNDPQGCNPPPPPPPPAGGGGEACGNGASNTGGPTALGDGSSSDAGTGCGPGAGSPIIIDTEGEGFHLTSAADGVIFDIRGDGHPVRIAWTAPGSHNAFLVLDRDGDGKISNGKELFGNFTTQDPSKHHNGFLALAEFDEPDQGGNSDGVIDEHDAIFPKLRSWIDANHDGISQPGELHTLPEMGIHSLSVRYFQSRREDQYGNAFRYKARVNPGKERDRRDETESSEPGRWAYDVFFVIGK